MAKEITIDINLDNILMSQAKLNLFEREFTRAVENGLEEFSMKFRMKLIENITRYGLPAGQILPSIHIVQRGSELAIFSSNEQLAYIEYGVGIVGSQNPHPMWGDWQYDVNQHGDSGWVYYPETEIDLAQNDVIITTKNGYKLAWTKGHEAKPFIYRTWLWGTRSIYQIVMKHVRRIKID